MNGFYPEGKIYKQPENKRCMSSLSALADAQVRETVLEAPVIMCDTEHNLIVDLGCVRGIIPRSEGAVGIDTGSTRDIALISRVGRTVCFVVTAFKTDGNGKTHAILSRKRAQELCREYMEFSRKRRYHRCKNHAFRIFWCFLRYWLRKYRPFTDRRHLGFPHIPPQRPFPSWRRYKSYY